MTNHTPAPTPSRAVYGFIFYLSFKMLFIVYLTWAIIPDHWFRAIGITYLPKRYWAITVPIYLLTVLTIFAFIIYPGLGLTMTPNIDDFHTITDKHSLPSNIKNQFDKGDVEKEGKCCKDINKCKKKQFCKLADKSFVENSIPLLSDLNIADVSKHLYFKDEV